MAGTLTMVIHGESGVGKSWLADSAPGPRLILDTEGGVGWTPSKKEAWDCKNEPPDSDSVVVTVRKLEDAQRAYGWLNSGKHPFRSVIFDSLTEMQKRIKRSVRSATGMQTQDWGKLLEKMEDVVSAFRDLTLHPSKPVENVLFVCGTKIEGETGRQRPMLQGQMGTSLPYYVDVVAYMALVTGEEEAEYTRRAIFLPIQNIVAKDRTDKLGTFMDDPTIEKIRALARKEA